MELNEEICPFKAGGSIYFQNVWLTFTQVEKGHSKGSVFIYFDWLSGGLVLSGKFISPLGGRALENQLFHQYSCPSYLRASEIFSDHWAVGDGVRKSHLALNHSSVHCWNGACAITLSKNYKFKCILNELLKHGRLHQEEFDALPSDDNEIYVISLWVVIVVSFHRPARIWTESSIILELVFFVSVLELCSSPVRVRKPDWELFLSATHHQVSPGCSHCHHMLYFPFKCEHSQSLHLLLVSVPSVQRESSGVSSGVCGSSKSFNGNKLWICRSYMLSLHHSRLFRCSRGEFDAIVSSSPTELCVWRRLLWRRWAAAFFFASLCYATFSPNIITYSHPRRNILPGPNLTIQ